MMAVAFNYLPLNQVRENFWGNFPYSKQVVTDCDASYMYQIPGNMSAADSLYARGITQLNGACTNQNAGVGVKEGFKHNSHHDRNHHHGHGHDQSAHCDHNRHHNVHHAHHAHHTAKSASHTSTGHHIPVQYLQDGTKHRGSEGFQATEEETEPQTMDTQIVTGGMKMTEDFTREDFTCLQGNNSGKSLTGNCSYNPLINYDYADISPNGAVAANPCSGKVFCRDRIMYSTARGKASGLRNPITGDIVIVPMPHSTVSQYGGDVPNLGYFNLPMAVKDTTRLNTYQKIRTGQAIVHGGVPHTQNHTHHHGHGKHVPKDHHMGVHGNNHGPAGQTIRN
jgi:hypothetical protein